MVRRIIKAYIPGLSMGFTIIIVISALFNLISGNTMDGFVPFIFEVLGFLMVAGVVDYMVREIDLKTYIGSCCCETIILYPISILFAYFGHWIGMRLLNIILYTVIYCVIMVGIHYYFYYITKLEAENINQYLSNYRKESEWNG